MNPVFLWYPNLVGYVRIISTCAALCVCFESPHYAAILYLIGQGLDAVDGVVARRFNQCSQFGAVLDMLTDRMSTAVLLVVLALLYPQRWGFFAFLIVLDMVSHWFQMYCKLAQGKSSHKGSKNPALNFYYTFPYALLVHCVGNEFFFVCLYVLAFPSLPATVLSTARLISYVCFPIFTMKQIMNVIQLYDAATEVAHLDWEQTQRK